MSSSLPAALDYLYTQMRQLPECQPPVVVGDAWPPKGAAQVAIGITPEENESDVEATYAELSGQEYEEPDVPCLISVHKLGANQKAARDAAFTIYNAVVALIRGDRRLGGAIRPGLPARISRFRLYQTAAATEAGEGRVCEIRFVLTWRHRG